MLGQKFVNGLKRIVLGSFLKGRDFMHLIILMSGLLWSLILSEKPVFIGEIIVATNHRMF